MNILRQLRERFRPVLLEASVSERDEVAAGEPDDLLQMIRPAQDPRFGDYQANCAMPLAKRLGRPPREVAERIVAGLRVEDLCLPPVIAGPGFINLTLRDDWIVRQVQNAAGDQRLAIPPARRPRTFVIDYSSPNVAKPMHVGHIRSTVIGDALCRTLKFLGHQVISDNHLGDWGSQFGMIIYGYKNFCDQAAYEASPVSELARLYQLVHKIAEYQACQQSLPELQERQRTCEAELERLRSGQGEGKAGKKALRRLQSQLEVARSELWDARRTIDAVQNDARLRRSAAEHQDVQEAVLQETARLHRGDPENLALWERFLPHCRRDIQRIYDRLGVSFDHELGESFYHDQLGSVVEELRGQGLARESEGAVCVFLEGFEAPMIIRKKDGAFLYATTDLATIRYRMREFRPDAILYVVDHRQSEHFEKLFAAARLWGHGRVELRHIRFGAVLGEDSRPYRTRSGDAVGLEGLLDEAVAKAHRVVSENDDAKPAGPELSDEERRRIARVVGHAAVKYADLSHNRTSDYVFSLDKMVALEGNTATYMQYSYARTQSIFARGGVDLKRLREAASQVDVQHPAERALALELLRFAEALDETVADYRPNLLTGYLFSLAKRFNDFYQQCSVLKADTERIRDSRLALCDLAGRTIRRGLSLLGIDVVEKM